MTIRARADAPVSRLVVAEVRHRREALRWSRADLAERAGMPISVITNLERTPSANRVQRPMTVDDLANLAEALGFSPDGLLALALQRETR